jgi:hypothetical protein
VDASRQLLVDLHDLPDEAVLAVCGLGPRVLQLETVLVDPLVRGLHRGHELLCADDEDDVGRAPRVGGELAARGGRDDQRAVAGDRVHAAQGVVGLAADRLHLLHLGGEVQREHLVPRRLVRAAAVDRVGDARVGQRHRRVGHHRRALRDAGQDHRARGGQVVHHLDAEPVLLERDDGRGQGALVGQRGEAVRGFGHAHGGSSSSCLEPTT